MTTRKFKVFNIKSRDTGEIVEYIVSDITEDELNREKKHNKTIRPDLAKFPVSHLYDAGTQLSRANQMCSYFNRIQEIQEEAVKNNTLLDFLKADATGTGA